MKSLAEIATEAIEEASKSDDPDLNSIARRILTREGYTPTIMAVAIVVKRMKERL